MLHALLVGMVALVPVQQTTDTIVPREGASRLALESPGGRIHVRTWQEDAIRIQAEHSSRTEVQIRRRGEVLDIDSEARIGPGVIVDYDVTVPADLDLDLEGHYTDITVEGAAGEVRAETLQGDVRIVGGRGTVRVTCTQGDIVVEGAEGRIELEGVAGNIRVTGASGDVRAETVGGTIEIVAVRARSVEAGTVGGRIRYQGPLEAGGQYFFGTHGAPIVLEVTGTVDASFSLATLHGRIQTELQGAPERFPRGERVQFTLGSGAAQVEAETFGGVITVRRAGGG